MGMVLLNEGNALRRQMQSFAWTDAKLCVGGCKALRGRMQSFAWADAMLCVGGCNALTDLRPQASVLYNI